MPNPQPQPNTQITVLPNGTHKEERVPVDELTPDTPLQYVPLHLQPSQNMADEMADVLQSVRDHHGYALDDGLSERLDNVLAAYSKTNVPMSDAEALEEFHEGRR